MTQINETKAPQAPLRSAKPSAFDGVIFDIDNVLVDTRKSYLDVIRWTVEIFLTEGKVPFFSKDKKNKGKLLLSPDDVSQFKLLGGFNDDWDCCYGILVYLLNLPVKGRSIQDLKKAINIKAFSQSLKMRPLGVSGIVKKLGRHPYVTIEKISRIFQEIYLGKALFEKVERRPALYWTKMGLISKEKLIFRKSTLDKLKSLGAVMGITTGRSRFEALYALRHFGIADYFSAITTMDEIRAAESDKKQSLRKPHPYSLVETAKKLGTGKKFLYVGDLPDDILTANRARDFIQVSSVGFPAFSSSPDETMEAMKRHHVDFLIEKPSQLTSLVIRGK